jgi:hypothetical protein
MPMFAVLAGWTISDCITRLKGSPNRLAIQLAVAALLVWQTGVQVVSAESRFWFINPDPSVPATMGFIADHVMSDDRAVLMISNSNAVSTGAIALALSRKANRLPSEIGMYPLSTPAEPHFVHLSWAVRRLTPIQARYIRLFYGQDVLHQLQQIEARGSRGMLSTHAERAAARLQVPPFSA